MKEKPVYAIEREFLGNISTTTLLVRMIRKHLENDRENGEITYGEKMENCIKNGIINIRIAANGG